MSEEPARVSSRGPIAFALAAALIPLGSTMLAVALPQIGGDLGVDPTTLTPLIVVSYLAVAVICQGPGGWLGDRIGHARALALGQIACALGAVTGALAPSLEVLVVARVLMAAGGAIMVPAAMALLRATTAAGRRARAYGMFGAVMSVAAALGPVLGGELTAHVHWRATFVAQLVPVIASALLARGLAFPRTGGATAATAGGWRAWWEVLRHREFAPAALVILLQNGALYALIFELPLLLQGVRGEDPAHVGRALLALTGASALASFVGGHLADTRHPLAPMIGGSLLAVAGLALLGNGAGLHHASQAVLPLIAFGLGLGACNGPTNAMAMSSVEPERAGRAAGLLATLRYVGGIAAMIALLPLRGDVPQDQALALHASALATMRLFAIAALVTALAMIPLRARPAPAA